MCYVYVYVYVCIHTYIISWLERLKKALNISEDQIEHARNPKTFRFSDAKTQQVDQAQVV